MKWNIIIVLIVFASHDTDAINIDLHSSATAHCNILHT